MKHRAVVPSPWRRSIGRRKTDGRTRRGVVEAFHFTSISTLVLKLFNLHKGELPEIHLFLTVFSPRRPQHSDMRPLQVDKYGDLMNSHKRLQKNNPFSNHAHL